MRYTLLENLSVSLTTEPLDMSQLIAAALFGGSLTTPTAYSSTKVYAKSEKILYTDPSTGKIEILYCKSAGTTGAFDATKWAIYSLFDGSGAGGNAMSDTTLINTLNNITIGSLLNI